MTDLSVQPTAESAPSLSQMERVVDTFTAPSKTFTDIKNGHKSWWLPFVIMCVLGYVFFAVVFTKIGMQQVVDNQMKLASAAQQERMANMTPEQKAMNNKISLYITEGAFAAGPVFTIIIGLIVALVLWGTINFAFGGKAQFGSVLSVWMYSMLPGLFKVLLGIIVMYAGAAPESFNIRNFSPTNAGAFLDPASTNKALYALASSIDIVTIWCLVLMGIGLAIVAGVKRSAGYIAVFGWWLVIILFSVGWAAIMG